MIPESWPHLGLPSAKLTKREAFEYALHGLEVLERDLCTCDKSGKGFNPGSHVDDCPYVLTSVSLFAIWDDWKGNSKEQKKALRRGVVIGMMYGSAIGALIMLALVNLI